MKDPMKLKFLIFLFFTQIIFSSQPDFLDATFLNNPASVQKSLLQHGFEKVFFTTNDGLQLCGLFKDQSATKKIEGTILYCAGFYPGTKEGMASFYTLFANQPYNFLLFDARGHQESQGSLFSYQNLKNYGNIEFQDIVAAINFLNTYNQKHNLSSNIIIHGICSGAFHAVKAYDFLRQHDCNSCKNIKGIIFDSGWLAMTDIVEPTLCAEIHKRLKNSWFCWLTQPLCYLTLQWYRLTLKHHHKNISGIANLIQNIACPMLFIHCIYDPYVPIAPVQNLVNHLHCPNSWWITHDIHANFHTQAPEIYTKKIMNFLKTTATTSSPTQSRMQTKNKTQPLAFINLDHHPWILRAQQQIKPYINNIIKNEILRTNPNATKFPEFYLKQRHLITLLYSKQIPSTFEQAVIIFFKTMSNYPKMSDLNFSNHVEFFGKDKNELVVKIQDPKQCLPKLRNFIINSLSAQLYEKLSIEQHNQFEFIPHETLGRIPVDEIEKSSNRETVEKIRQKILKEIQPVLHKLSTSNIMQPTELSVYGNDFKIIFIKKLGI